ncbi:lipoyl(octanoyl) transferase LipB [Alkalibacter mobilis]|uniref:lipoyl(octanoyl) transferase LipB n=1 Tax=Alkalibacter mobilis TaxID=2787712 RepID=UPI00189ECAF6|nr:lipoyl(octanoyl) transferase LipB [Alkalibacter mobilis]MBF7097492.1 lipoyl(octanoyl) transferase LipB [Alkalibacter mobilis]
MGKRKKINIVDLGKMEYSEALKIQTRLRDLRVDEKIEDTLLMVEHDPVLTLGSRGKMENILVSEEFLKSNGIEVVQLRRGGDVTYHGPGQIVGYPIVDMKNYDRDLRRFVQNLKQIFIAMLEDEFNIHAEGKEGDHTGVWLGNEKITAIGISVSKMVTMHGFAFNVNTDLNHFKWINPCGFSDKGVTSLEKLMGHSMDMKKMKKLTVEYYCKMFDVDPQEMDVADLMDIMEGTKNDDYQEA